MNSYYSAPELRAIAQAQRMVLWAILAFFLFLVPSLRLLRIFLVLFQVLAVFRLATALRSRAPFLWALGMIVPILSLVLLILLNSAANRALEGAGIRVGLMGAKQEDLDRLPDE